MSLNRRTSVGAALVVMVVALMAGPAVAAQHEGYPSLSEDWEKHYNAGDAAGVAGLYTEDGVIMPPGAGAAQGRAAIEAMLIQDMAANARNQLAIDVVEQSASGDLGFARGTFSMMDASGNTVDKGKWLEVRKMVDGKWYIHSDIWNSDMAPVHQHDPEHQHEVEHDHEHDDD